MRKKLFTVLSICWMIAIFAFSSRNAELSTQDSTSVGKLICGIFMPGFYGLDPESQLTYAGRIDHPIRKLAHMSEYAVLGFLAAGSYADRRKKRLDAIGIPFLIGALYAASDELHQMFVPGRSCQATDVFIDSCGVLAGVLAGWLMFSRFLDRA